MSTQIESIRNIAICGHTATGKTSLNEQILFHAGIIKKPATVESGNTVSDYMDEEVEHGGSIHTALTHIDWHGTKINMLDTPGLSDYIGEVVAAFRAGESAVMVIDAHSGIQTETVKLWRRLEARDMPRMVFVNKMDDPSAEFFSAIEGLKEFGVTPIPITLPVGKGADFHSVVNLLKMKAYRVEDDGTMKESEVPVPEEAQQQAEEYHLKMIEMAAEGDDQLTEKYFESGDLTLEEAVLGLREGLYDNKFVPVFCGAALKGIGITPLMDFIAEDSPAPGRAPEPTEDKDGSPGEAAYSADGDPSCVIFKTGNDKYSGKLSLLKMVTGTLRPGTDMVNIRDGKKERIGKVFTAQGKSLSEIGELSAGDIGVVTKVESLATNDTLSGGRSVHYKPLALPHPIYSLAIAATEQRHEDKLNEHLHRIAAEDLTFSIEYNTETGENVISGMGELHIKTVLDRIEKEYKITAETKTPRVPYRESITKPGSAEYTHKKQSGGHGQYGKVMIEIKPLERGEQFSFSNDIKGGSIGKGYMPGIEKGLLEAMKEGVLAGYPLVDIGVSVVDGKEHPVDSSEMAFKLAAKAAMKEAVRQAGVVLLEPYMDMTVFIENRYLGDVMSDISGRRGRVTDQGSIGSGLMQVKAQVPQGELLRYAIDLRSMTAGTGSFELEFSHYEQTSGKVSDDIVKQANRE